LRRWKGGKLPGTRASSAIRTTTRKGRGTIILFGVNLGPDSSNQGENKPRKQLGNPALFWFESEARLQCVECGLRLGPQLLSASARAASSRFVIGSGRHSPYARRKGTHGGDGDAYELSLNKIGDPVLLLCDLNDESFCIFYAHNHAHRMRCYSLGAHGIIYCQRKSHSWLRRGDRTIAHSTYNMERFLRNTVILLQQMEK
jgi:hypothetical protein